tara:strand:- start:411 stop:905 length:495 start_codon:yes stop_codon:yes gene_type:complete
MLLIVLKPTDRATRYLQRDNIELIRLETVLNFISRYVDSRKKVENVTITFDIDCRKEDSEFHFKSRHIVIAGISKNNKKTKTRAGRLKYLIECLVHEFRHCLQEIIFKKDANDVTYGSTDDDEYRNNPLEVDAYWFEEKYSKKAYDMYRYLKKYKLKDVDVFHE